MLPVTWHQQESLAVGIFFVCSQIKNQMLFQQWLNLDKLFMREADIITKL